MSSHIPRLVLWHAVLTGVSVAALAALGSEGLNDPLARSVLIAASSAAAAVGSGITAFIMLNVEQNDAARSKRKRPQPLQRR